MKKLCCFLVAVLFMLSVLEKCFAQENYDLGEVVVTATKTEETAEEIGSSFSVVTSEEISGTGKEMVGEVLQDIPGVEVIHSGGIGSLTEVYLRGTQPGQTLVLIDGIEVNDPMSPSRGFDFGNLTVEDIDRIEVIRGPQSTLYGSDAMGGVINIITKKGKGKMLVSGKLEAGAYTTYKENAGISGKKDKIDYAFSATRIDSDSFSTAKYGIENDGYYNSTLSGKAGIELFGNARLGAVLRYIDSKKALDDGAFLDDPDYYSKRDNLISKLEFDQQLFNWWAHNLSLSYTDTKRYYTDRPNNMNDFQNIDSWYKGELYEAEWQNNFNIKKIDTITAGIDYKEERGSSFYKSSLYTSEFPRKSMNIFGIYAQNILRLWERLFFTAGIRADDNNKYDTSTNYRLAASYIHRETNTQLKGSYGTGFKAPTLFQMYSIYGDTGLAPEKSRGFDAGVIQKFFNDKISAGVTYFYNRFRNLIEWDPALSKYSNIGRAITKGVEAEAYYYPVAPLGFGINYTYMQTEDMLTGEELLRRSKNKVSLNINWKFVKNGNLNFICRYIGTREDMNFVTYNRVDMPGYFVADLFCSYDVNENFGIFGKIENLFDKDYEEIRGFNTAGISGYTGAKIKM